MGLEEFEDGSEGGVYKVFPRYLHLPPIGVLYSRRGNGSDGGVHTIILNSEKKDGE